MKKTLLLQVFGGSLLALASTAAQAQTAGVGIGTTAPNASAALDIVSSSKGLLLPRLTEAARQAMGTGSVPPPATGLIVYQTDGAQPGFWFASGPGSWVRLTDQGTANNQYIQNQTSADQAGGFRVGGNGSLKGYLGLGTGAPASRLDIVNDGGGNGVTDDVNITSYGGTGAPGIGLIMNSMRGSKAAPANLQADDPLGIIVFAGQGQDGADTWLSGIGANYRYNGTSAKRRSELNFYTSGYFQAQLDTLGRLGVGLTPNYKLDVAGTIHAATSQGVMLDAQDRPLITRGWDTFASGNYKGLGRWGLFMEPSSLTLGIPATNASLKRFQWVTYNDDSSIEQRMMQLLSNGYLGVGSFGAALPGSRVDIVSEAGGPDDDMQLRSFGAAVNPGLSLRRYRGTMAAPANVQNGDFLGEIGLAGYYNGGANNPFMMSGMQAFYKGDGTTGLADLRLVSSGQERVRISETGSVGIGNPAPAFPLDVNGTIHAVTSQGVTLDAQDRPLITRGWDAFTSGNYSGLGRWGLFMEPFNLTFGVPVLANRQFQWATYNLDSSVGSQLMVLNQAGNLGVGVPSPAATVEIARGTGANGSLGIRGTTNESHFNYGTAEDTYLRGGKAASNVIINDLSTGGVAVGAATVTAGEKLDVSGSTRTTEVHTPATGTANMLALAYGQVASAGTSISNSSGNVTVSHIAAGHYRLTFTGLGTTNFDFLAVSLSLNGATAGFITSEGASGGLGTLDVYTYTSNGNTLVDRYFNFSVFKP